MRGREVGLRQRRTRQSAESPSLPLSPRRQVLTRAKPCRMPVPRSANWGKITGTPPRIARLPSSADLALQKMRSCAVAPFSMTPGGRRTA